MKKNIIHLTFMATIALALTSCQSMPDTKVDDTPIRHSELRGELEADKPDVVETIKVEKRIISEEVILE